MIMNQNSEGITQITDYLNNLIKSMSRSVYQEAALANSRLYMIADNTVFYTVDLTGKIDPAINFGFRNNMDELSTTIYDNSIMEGPIKKYAEMKFYELSNNKIYEDDNLREDEKFEEYANAKASDGSNFYFVHASNCSPFIPVFSGLPILSKNDRVKMEMYDLGNHIILVHMNVFKKKFNLPYDLYYKIIDVNRPIR